jgi:hypothetical protein
VRSWRDLVVSEACREDNTVPVLHPYRPPWSVACSSFAHEWDGTSVRAPEMSFDGWSLVQVAICLTAVATRLLVQRVVVLRALRNLLSDRLLRQLWIAQQPRLWQRIQRLRHHQRQPLVQTRYRTQPRPQ